jgi:hypothetical protein
MAHGGLVGYANAFAAGKTPDPVMVISSIENPRRATTLIA